MKKGRIRHQHFPKEPSEAEVRAAVYSIAPFLFARKVDSTCRIVADALRAARAAAPVPWQPIESAPKDRSVLLVVSGTTVPVYCGRYRTGTLGEPQQSELAWRCDSSGRFANPTHWAEIPPPPVPKED